MAGKTTEFCGVTMPNGWKAKLKAKGNGNVSQGVCIAIAQAFGWEYDAVPGVRKSAPQYVVDVASSHKVADVRAMLAGLDVEVKPRTIEKSKLQQVVLVTNLTNGETSETPSDHEGRDRRVVKTLERKIITELGNLS